MIHPPLNTVLRGVPGTGKTTAARRIFAEVGEVCETVMPVRGAGVAEEERGYGG